MATKPSLHQSQMVILTIDIKHGNWWFIGLAGNKSVCYSWSKRIIFLKIEHSWFVSSISEKEVINGVKSLDFPNKKNIYIYVSHNRKQKVGWEKN